MLLNIAHKNFTWCIYFNYFGRIYHIQAMWPESKQLAETRECLMRLCEELDSHVTEGFLMWPHDTCIKKRDDKYM